MTSSPLPRVPDTIEGYRIGALRRTAGALAVHVGTDRLDLTVDVHVVRASALADDAAAAFVARLRALADLRTEALLPYVTGGRHDDLYFAVAKTVDGAAVDEVVARGGALAEDRVLAIGAAVVGVLVALERVHLRHGDLTPRRILLPGAGRVAVAPPRLVPVAVAPRNERYQSPEEARGAPGDVRSDLFVVGLILLESLRGEPSFRGAAADATRALASGQVPTAAGLQGIRAGTRALLSRLLAADPAHRFATAAEAHRAIVAAAAHDDSEPTIADAPTARAARDAAPRAAPEAAPETAPIALPSAAPAAPAAAAAAAPVPAHAAAAVPAPSGAGTDTLRRSPGRLYLKARLGEALLELDESVHVGRPADAIDLVAQPEPFPEATIRIERTPDADVLHALVPGVTVGGAPVERRTLVHGDVVAAGTVQGRYERDARAALRATGAGASGPPPGRDAARLVLAGAAVVALAAIALSAHTFRVARRSADAAADRAAAASRDLADARKSAPAAAGAQGAGGTTREQAARDAFDAAVDFARRNAGDPTVAAAKFREVAERYEETGHASLARVEATEIERRARGGGGAELDAAVAKARKDAAEGRLDDALNALRNFAELRPGTVQGERAQAAAVQIENEIVGRFEADLARVERAEASGDVAAAFRLLDAVMEYVPKTLRERALAVRARLEAARSRSATAPRESGHGASPPPGPGPREPPTGPRDAPDTPGAPPAPPGPPGPPATPPNEPSDAEQAAESAFRAAKKLDDAGDRDGDAIDAFLAFLRTHKDTRVGAKYDLEARKRITRLAEGPAGLTRLFRGNVEKAEKGRLRVRYDFEHPDQLLDFRDVEAFEAPPRARWTVAGGAARAKGAGALVLDATFRIDALTTSVTVNPERAQDLGIAYVDASEPRRFYLFILQNRFFTLGKGPGAKAFEENAIVLFGPGMWRDTPAGQIGYVRKCGAPEPSVRPGEDVHVQAGKDGATVWMKFPNGKQISGSAHGDVKLDFQGIEPAVFVLNSSGTFDDFVVEGTPDPEWVARRWRAILSNL